MTASSLYEAVALGLKTIREEEWTGEIPEGANTVEVSVAAVPVTHYVTIRGFQKWLRQTGKTPRDMTQRQHVREILGLTDRTPR